MAGLVGKNILIVDEVDDTRTTLEYAVKELEKDVDAARQKLKAEGNEGDDKGPAKFSIFVLHVSRDLHSIGCWRYNGLTWRCRTRRSQTSRRRGTCRRR